MLQEKRIRVLISAYACEPNKGSEPGVGWNWAVHLAKFCDVTVLTRSNNKGVIENELPGSPASNLSFIYFDIALLSMIKKKIPFGVQIYYLLWEFFAARFIANKFPPEKNFDIVHHLTFNSFQSNGFLFKFKVPSVRGPVGGGMFGHLHSFFKTGFVYGISESTRSTLTYLGKYRCSVRKSLRCYTKIIFANTDTKHFLGKAHDSVMLETGIRSEFINMKTPREAKQHLKILFAGALIPRKGVMLLIDAISKTKVDATLTIAGNGRLKRKCGQRISELKLTDRVNIMDAVGFNELQKLYSEFDIFAFPSLRDTSGNVMLEAMSKGLPVIAFDHHGAKDIVAENCGIKIKVTNYSKMVRDFAFAIDLLANDLKLRTRLGAAAIERVREKYLWENKAKEMMAVYNELLLSK